AAKVAAARPLVHPAARKAPMRRTVPAVVLCVACACASTSTSTSTPTATATRSLSSPTFIEDDYPRALAQARAEGKPLFVDAWAPWCHTCLSMRAYVFPDEAMRPLARDFVWLAVDTEKPESAAFLARFAMQVWPTLWVIDPKT